MRKANKIEQVSAKFICDRIEKCWDFKGYAIKTFKVFHYFTFKDFCYDVINGDYTILLREFNQ